MGTTCFGVYLMAIIGDKTTSRIIIPTILSLLLQGCASQPNSCNGPVQEDLRYGVTSDRDTAVSICCHNTDFAEYAGYFESKGLFSRLDTNGVTTFYDSVCGKPLFRAPVGRSFSDWQSESQEHGWPSFRSQEIFKENVVFRGGGEMRSTCGTHLGHNIPDSSGSRYCIDLVCIAGSPSAKSNATQLADLRDVPVTLARSNSIALTTFALIIGGVSSLLLVSASWRYCGRTTAQPLLSWDENEA